MEIASFHADDKNQREQPSPHRRGDSEGRPGSDRHHPVSRQDRSGRALGAVGTRPGHRPRRDSRLGSDRSGQPGHRPGDRQRPPAVPPRSADAINDRALGAFLGLAVGDAVGTTLEFRPRDAQPRLDDMVGGGPFRQPPGGWTDDTAMALALADSLAAPGTLDCRDLMDRFVRWWQHGEYSHTGGCFDIGNTVLGALERYLRTGDPLAGSTDPGTAGNGSLMRLAPVALRFWNDRPRLVAAAADQSCTTHGAEEAVDACRAFAELLADAIAGSPRVDVMAPRPFEGAAAIARIMAGSWRGRARDTIDSSGYVVHTLEAAMWSVARTGNFRNAVLLAANLADDADTVAVYRFRKPNSVSSLRTLAPWPPTIPPTTAAGVYTVHARCTRPERTTFGYCSSRPRAQ